MIEFSHIFNGAHIWTHGKPRRQAGKFYKIFQIFKRLQMQILKVGAWSNGILTHILPYLKVKKVIFGLCLGSHLPRGGLAFKVIQNRWKLCILPSFHHWSSRNLGIVIYSSNCIKFYMILHHLGLLSALTSFLWLNSLIYGVFDEISTKAQKKTWKVRIQSCRGEMMRWKGEKWLVKDACMPEW